MKTAEEPPNEKKKEVISVEIKAVKFGGTSLCDAAQMRKAASIVRAEPARRAVVVSAPGKRTGTDEKLTDLLYRAYDTTDAAIFSATFASLTARIDEIRDALGAPLDFSPDYEAMRQAYAARDGRDFFVSRGEYFSARLMAFLLGFPMLDAAETIFFRADGTLDADRTRAVLRDRLSALGRAVIPGFYGAMPDGTIRTFSRGGSDITGAIVADAAGASLYENFTDVSGFLLADPKMVDKSEIIGIISYKELRRLSFMGAAVLHEDAVLPAKAANIPICIKNTNAPQDAGTLIVPKKERTGVVSGIAGRKGFSKLMVCRDRIGGDAAALRALCAVFERRSIPIYGMPRSIDAVAFILRREDVGKDADGLLDEIRRIAEPESVRFYDGMALFCVIGEEMPPLTLSMALRAVAALGEMPLLLDGGADDLGWTFGVREEQYERVIRAVYDAVARFR